MKLDKKYISATINFLKLFNLKLEDNKVGKLSQKLDYDGQIFIYDCNNNEVGEIIKFDNCYCMNISYFDSKISVTSYRNTKEKSSYVFRYSIFKYDTRESVDGYYEIRKNMNQEDDFHIESNYKLYKNHGLNLKCYFDNINNMFMISDYNNEIKIKLDFDNFEAVLKSWILNVKKYDLNKIYYEKLNRKKDSHYNKAEGYTLEDNKTFEDEILTIIDNELEDYYEYIKYMIDRGNDIFPHFYENNVNSVLYKDCDNSKKQLLLDRKK